MLLKDFYKINSLEKTEAQKYVAQIVINKDHDVFKGHFPGNPVTPGVIITEIMAQIGLVVLGIHLMLTDDKQQGAVMDEGSFPLLTSTNVEFYKMVLPEEKVIVSSEKQYFRFGKLKCLVKMHNTAGELIAKGTFAGVIKNAVLMEKGTNG